MLYIKSPPNVSLLTESTSRTTPWRPNVFSIPRIANLGNAVPTALLVTLLLSGERVTTVRPGQKETTQFLRYSIFLRLTIYTVDPKYQSPLAFIFTSRYCLLTLPFRTLSIVNLFASSLISSIVGR